jgi:hypothetical protein
MNTTTQKTVLEIEKEIWSGEIFRYGNRPVLELLNEVDYKGSKELHTILANKEYYKNHNWRDSALEIPPLSIDQFFKELASSSWCVQPSDYIVYSYDYKYSIRAKNNLEFLYALKECFQQKGICHYFCVSEITEAIKKQEKNLKLIENQERILHRIKAIERLIRSCKTNEVSSTHLGNIPTFKIFSKDIRKKHCRTLARLTRVYPTVEKLAQDVSNIQLRVFGQDTRLKMIIILVTLHKFLKKREGIVREKINNFDHTIRLIEEGIELYASRTKSTKAKLLRELEKYNCYQSLHKRHSTFRGSSVRDEYYEKILNFSTTQEQLFFVVKLGEDTKCWPKAVRLLANLKNLSPFKIKR